MSKIEQDLNSRFKHEQLSTNANEMDEMWNAISTQLDPEPHRFNTIIILVTSLLLVFASVCAYQWSFQSELDAAHTQSQDYLISEVNRTNELLSVINQTKLTEEETILSSQKTDGSEQIDFIKNAKNSSQINSILNEELSQEKDNDGSVIVNRNKNLLGQETVRRVKINEIITKPGKFTQPIPVHRNVENNLVVNVDKTMGSSIISSIPRLDYPEVIESISDQNTSPILTFQLSEYVVIKEKNKNNLNWYVGLIGGINYSNVNYKSTESPDVAMLKNDTESAYSGSSFGINGGIVLNNKWIVNSGLEYHQLWSEFNYKNIDVDTEYRENVVIKILVSGMTGDTLDEILGDTTLTITKTRTIKHFNSYKRITLPIEVGLQRQFGKMTYGLKTGVVLALSTFANGKIIDGSRDVTTFYTNGEQSPYNMASFSLRFSPMFGYSITDHFSIQLFPQYQWTRSNPTSTINADIHQFNINLGLSYSLN